jgi:3-hydroxypropanoate dehydrogenase
MSRLSDESLDLIFRTARTYGVWRDEPVSDETLHELYDLMKLAPTSANMSPARIVFLRTKEAKERLLSSLSPMNVEKTMSAPVTAIVAYDLHFFEKLPKLFPFNPKFKEMFENSPELAQTAAVRNGGLQGGYFILAARAVGLDCGPMSGFDNAKLDAEFFAGTSIKSNFLCNLGHGEAANLHPRAPRLDFEEACRIL